MSQVQGSIPILLCLRKTRRNQWALERLLPNMNHARILLTQADFVPRTLNHLLLISIDGCLARLCLLFA